MLVREMHHRVKNNMQLVISLLNLHTRRVRDPQTENAFADARGRINALATLHRRLYEAENLQHVDLKWFLEDLCNELRRGGLARGRDIQLVADLPNLPIGADIAVPLGLLVTEAITNAYKHAFRGYRAGRIELTGRTEGDRVCVSVRDNGVGLAAHPPSADSSGLGRSLIEAFARQLGADLEIEVNSGTSITVRFPLKPAQQSV
jgi:two-component sensor histidine kinase